MTRLGHAPDRANEGYGAYPITPVGNSGASSSTPVGGSPRKYRDADCEDDQRQREGEETERREAGETERKQGKRENRERTEGKRREKENIHLSPSY